MPILIALLISLNFFVACSKSTSSGSTASVTTPSPVFFLTQLKNYERQSSIGIDFSIKSQASYGTISREGTGLLKYTPTYNFTGRDLAKITLEDGRKTIVQLIIYVVDTPSMNNVTNDTFFNGDFEIYPEFWWGLEQSKAFDMWAYHTACDNFRIGIIDTGVNFNHPDLTDNKDTSITGYDFVNEDSDPNDDMGHGTHVAGIIAARGNNATAISGICQTAKLVAIKVLDEDGEGLVSTIVQGINYANTNSIKITNNSYGIAIPTTTSDKTLSESYWEDYLLDNSHSISIESTIAALTDAITDAQTAGNLFIAAAGNSAKNNDELLMIPANYSNFIDNVISVAAVDPNDDLAYFSNTGLEYVDIAAPGVSIENLAYDYSSGVELTYTAEESGTSMAAPYVTGAAAIIWDAKWGANRSYAQVKAALLGGASILGSDSRGKIKNDNMLNIVGAYNAL